jgi:hypothetical protein
MTLVLPMFLVIILRSVLIENTHVPFFIFVSYSADRYRVFFPLKFFPFDQLLLMLMPIGGRESPDTMHFWIDCLVVLVSGPHYH